MKTNGVEPHIEQIEALDEQHAIFLEVCLIELLGRKDLGRGTLLNLTDGGDGRKTWSDEQRKHHAAKLTGRTHTEETKARMRAAARPASAGMTDKKHTEETKLKIGAAHAGVQKPKTASHRTKLSQAQTGKRREYYVTSDNVTKWRWSNDRTSV